MVTEMQPIRIMLSSYLQATMMLLPKEKKQKQTIHTVWVKGSCSVIWTQLQID